jgi:hypothetical protein
VLAAAADPRATLWHERAHQAVRSQADAMRDEASRQRFVGNVPHHRQILALGQTRGAAG